MYLAVFIIACERNLLIPAKWIYHLDLHSLANNGVYTIEKHLLFYSKDDKSPDFLKPIRNVFDINEDACYYGNIVKVFGRMLYYYFSLQIVFHII